jgi:hypothetical protein
VGREESPPKPQELRRNGEFLKNTIKETDLV